MFKGSGCVPPSGFMRCSAGRDRQAEVRAQRVAFIIGAEQTACLEDGHHFGDEAGELRGMAEMDVEPVERPPFEPALKFVGNAARRSHEWTAAPGPRLFDRLAQG